MTARLTPRQAAFVRAYFDETAPSWHNATRSAAAAGYRWPGKQGPRLCQFPAVRAALAAGLRAERLRLLRGLGLPRSVARRLAEWM